jgi:mRNA-decapping enzyme subunit 2
MSSKRNTRSNTPSSINSNTKGTDNSLNNDDNQQEDKMMHSQAFLDAIEDVHTRFILNLPQEELATSNRLFFQIEQAWWFYEDLICDELEDDAMNQQSNNISPLQQQQYSQLPRFKKMYTFARKMFEISSLLSPFLSDFDQMWQEFSKYKRKISTYGTILLNTDCTKVVLCQEYHGKAWTFPAGKVNQNERGRDAAARETYEETGFDPTCNI